jgi:hypothetical protein
MPSLDLQARLELQLWWETLQAEVASVRLTLPQACYLADVLQGECESAEFGQIISTHISKAIASDGMSGISSRWPVNEDSMLVWAGRLRPVTDHAVRDAIWRWWRLGAEASVEGFARVGLRLVPE